MNNNKEETGKYFMEAELAFRSYEPKELKVGMTFLHNITEHLPEPIYSFFTLEELPVDHDAFMATYGAPVHMFIIQADDDTQMLALPMNIGLIIVGSEENYEYKPITDSIINIILNDYDGYVDILCDENGNILHQGEKVVLAFSDDWEEEEPDEDDED